MTGNEQQLEKAEGLVLADRRNQLSSVPDTVRRLIGERTSIDLRQPGQDGSDAVVEVLCHLQDWEEITGERVWKILNEDNPDLESWDDSLWSIEHDYIARDGLEVVEQFTVQRTKLMEMLDAIEEEDLTRTAELEGRGPITLKWLLKKTARHDEKHIIELTEALS